MRMLDWLARFGELKWSAALLPLSFFRDEPEKKRETCFPPVFLEHVMNFKEADIMLDQLSSIKWSDLSHAYGPADDIPPLIRDLASSDEQTRRDALRTLYTTIYHQGTVY